MPTGDCHLMRIWLEGTFGSQSLSHPPGWLPVLNQVFCAFVQQKLEPPPRMEVPPIPLMICPRAAHFSHNEIFPNFPQFVIFVPYCTTSHRQGEFGSVIFSAALQETGGYYYIYIYLLVMSILFFWHSRCDSSQRRSHLPPGHASTLLLALKMWHFTQEVTFTSWSCQHSFSGTKDVTLSTKEATKRMAVSTWHLSAGVFANKARNTHASGCVTPSCALSHSAKGKILCQESLSNCSFSPPASLVERREGRLYCLELRGSSSTTM